MNRIRKWIVPQRQSDRLIWLAGLLIWLFLGWLGYSQSNDILDSIDEAINLKRAIWLLTLSWAAGGACLVLAPANLPERGLFTRLTAWIFALLSPLYLFYTMEAVTTEARGRWGNFKKIFGAPGTRPHLILLNTGLLFLLVLLLTLLFNSLRYGPLAASLLCMVFSITNVYVREIRGNALSAVDFTVLGTALDVAGDYRIALKFRVYLGLLLWFFFLVIAFKLSNTRLSRSFKAYLFKALAGLAVFALAMKLLVLSSFLKDQGLTISYFNTMRSYHHFGVTATLARSVQEALPHKPEGYSVKAVQALAARYQSDPIPQAEDTPTREHPNVVVIIDESFTDLSLLGNFEKTQDDMPFLRSLKENCLRGLAYASVRGGQTANTEFEFLTGCSMGLLPSAAVPFQIYLRQEMPSMATRMAQEGYCGMEAFHPWKGGNYNRTRVYSLLGFRKYYYKSNTPIPLERFRSVTSDESDFENLLSIYETDRKEGKAPWFFYNMTVQNHSPYNVDFEDFTPDIKATGLSQDYRGVNQYLSLVHVTDQALEKVIDYFQALSEPTVLLFFGDHQPKLEDGFYEEVTGKSNADRNVSESMILYEVPFWAWANYDLEEEEGLLGSMNYLEALLARWHGGELTGFQKFLLEMHSQIPVINALGYYGADGSFYLAEDETSPYYSWIRDYALLEYNLLFDSSHHPEGFFELTSLPNQGPNSDQEGEG